MKDSNENYDKWHSKYALEDDTSSDWHLFVKKNISIDKDMDNRKLLEIGCGRGGFSNYLSMLTLSLKSIHACDFSNSAIEIAKSKFGDNDGKIIWKQEDVQKLTFDDNYFDTIVSCETIEHVPNPDIAIKELFRVLKPGGRLFLTCPNYFNFFGLWCVYRYLIGKPYTEGQPYVNYPIYPLLLKWIDKSGLTIEQSYTSRLVLPLRAHYHFYVKKMPGFMKWFGFRTFFILRK